MEEFFGEAGMAELISTLQAAAFIIVSLIMAHLKNKLTKTEKTGETKDKTIQDQDELISLFKAETQLNINSQINLFNVLQMIVINSKMKEEEKVRTIEVLKASKDGLNQFLKTFDEVYEKYKGSLPSSIIVDRHEILKDANNLVKDTLSKYEELPDEVSSL